MAGFQCPFCNQVMSINPNTLVTRRTSFSVSDFEYIHNVNPNESMDAVKINFYKCPNCDEITIRLEGMGIKTNSISIPIRPQFSAIQFPEYVPQSIRNDYQEACAIINLSPKSSATLARRCLQGMIRDYWGITKSRLIDEINELEGKIPATQWKVIDGIRRIGNIGAHMEKDINLIIDIDTNEAQKLIKLIEHLIKSWYIERNEQELLYAAITQIDEDKQLIKKSKP